jgi:hypothetical protein
MAAGTAFEYGTMGSMQFLQLLKLRHLLDQLELS